MATKPTMIRIGVKFSWVVFCVGLGSGVGVCDREGEEVKIGEGVGETVAD